MLFDHDRIDGFGIPECKESETSGSPRSAVAHDCAFRDLAEL